MDTIRDLLYVLVDLAITVGAVAILIGVAWASMQYTCDVLIGTDEPRPAYIPYIIREALPLGVVALVLAFVNMAFAYGWQQDAAHAWAAGPLFPNIMDPRTYLYVGLPNFVQTLELALVGPAMFFSVICLVFPVVNPLLTPVLAWVFRRLL